MSADVVEHPAFVCAREGHEPTVMLRTSLPQASYICACKRCGRMVEFPLAAVPPEEKQP